MNSLVIVESPAKCKKIASYLGPGYTVIASFGHLRNITCLQDIDINNHFNTKYTIINEKLKQVEKIRIEINKSHDVIIATDDDREGESIAWHICDLFGLSISNTKRIIFHEITESAIQSAISHPKRINMNVVHAQQSRQILDLLVGFTISPILWNCISKKYDNSLSAGRCQTPALRLIYDNYLELKQSPGKLVYNTSGYFTSLNILFELNKQFDEQTNITTFLELCKSYDFKFSVSTPKRTIKKSPEPLITSTLQQLASNELHMSPKETMKYAQQLYEGGHITYMRTDSKKYSTEFINNTKQFISTTYGAQFISQNIDNLIVTKQYNIKLTIAEKKGIPPPQEAHEAIRPVNIHNRTPILEDGDTNGELPTKAIKLYELIWTRTIESCMSSAQYNSIVAKIDAPLDTEFLYRTEQPIFLGWQIVKPMKTDDTNYYQFLQTLKQNVSIKPKKIDSKFTIIELKHHYTEARLIQLLEEKGIGRPSTFASLVDKIQERKYVEKQNINGKEIENIDFSLIDDNIELTTNKREFGNEKHKLVIQPLGIIVIEFLIEKFNKFFNYEYTKEMEDDLDKIANGIIDWHTLCTTCNNNLNDITNNSKDFHKFSIHIDDKHTLIIGKYGPVVKYDDKTNVSFIPVRKNLDLEQLKHETITLSDVIETNVIDKESIGKYKGKDLYIKKGKYGLYAQWGNETKSIKEEFGSCEITEIQYIDVIRYLDKDMLDPSKPTGFVRDINKNISIRTGKYGDYIFYKRPRIKKPEFYKLNGFNGDYKKCDKDLLLNWIKLTYKIE